MKNKFILWLCVVAVVVMAFLWLLHSREKSELVPMADAPETKVQEMETAKLSGVDARQAGIKASSASITPTTLPAAVTITPEEKEAKANAELEAKNIPFDFYGRVIDQDSNALAGVKFKLAVRHWSTTTLGAIHIERETDADGRFDIHGETGDAFDVESMGKEGYESEPGQHTFGAMGGSFESPVVFKMWSANAHEQLITGGKSFHIQPDGKPYVIDLTKGTIAESGDGDLKVWIKYATQVVRGQTYDWSCEIAPVGGGLLEESDLNASMYVAPTEGYAPAFQLQQQIKGGQSGSIGTRRFYVKLKNGQEYGRITVEMDAPYNDEVPGRVRVSYALNPSGSRILR